MEERERKLILDNVHMLVQGTSDEAFQNILNKFKNHNILNNHMLTKIKSFEEIEKSKKMFFEMVPKRGPKAFTLLTNSLREEGLSDLLRRTSLSLENEIVLNGNNNFEDGSCLGSLRINNVSRSLEIINDKVYHLDSKPKGLVLIINNNKFRDTVLDPIRYGSEKDVNRLEDILKKRGFQVFVRQNLSKAEFEECITTFAANRQLKDVDSVIVFVMTHGKGDPKHSRKLLLSTYDNESIDSEWIIEQFNAVNCISLADKPKIIFYQACRGRRSNGDYGVSASIDVSRTAVNGTTTESNSFFDVSQEQRRIVPSLSDMLVVYSTCPGRLSERNANGSFFIQDLCDILRDTTEIEVRDLVDMVCRKLRERFDTEPATMRYMQVPHYESLGFNKKFILKINS